MPPRTLKHGDVLTAIASRPDVTGKTINNYVSVLRDRLALAVKDTVLTANPADHVPRTKHRKPLPDPFSREKSECIIA